MQFVHNFTLATPPGLARLARAELEINAQMRLWGNPPSTGRQ